MKLTKAQSRTLRQLRGERRADCAMDRCFRSNCDALVKLGLARFKGPGPHEYVITEAGIQETAS